MGEPLPAIFLFLFLNSMIGLLPNTMTSDAQFRNTFSTTFSIFHCADELILVILGCRQNQQLLMFKEDLGDSPGLLT